MPNLSQTIYECSKCGAQSTKWAGRCLECGAWGTLDEVMKSDSQKYKSAEKMPMGKVLNFNEVSGKILHELKLALASWIRFWAAGLFLDRLYF